MDRSPDTKFFLPELIRFSRRRRELTQRDFAAQAGMTQSSVARLESGKHPIKEDTLMRLAEVLGAKSLPDFLRKEIAAFQRHERHGAGKEARDGHAGID